MGKFKIIKDKKGATMTDVIIAMLIILIFTGILTSGFYNIYKQNISIAKDAIVSRYCITILEDIDKMTYEEVTEELNDNLAEKYNIEEEYNVKLKIENYNQYDETKQDIIKIITLSIDYEILGNMQNYTVQKLKIKEI